MSYIRTGIVGVISGRYRAISRSVRAALNGGDQKVTIQNATRVQGLLCVLFFCVSSEGREQGDKVLGQREYCQRRGRQYLPLSIARDARSIARR